MRQRMEWNPTRSTRRRRFLVACAWWAGMGVAPTATWGQSPESIGSSRALGPAGSLRPSGPSAGLEQTLTIRDSRGEPVVVSAMAVDPGGRFIAVAGEDDQIQILDGNRFDKRAVLRGHRDRIRCLAIDYRGEAMASVGNDGRLILWSTQNGEFKKLQSLANTPALARVRFAPDGNRLAAVGFTPSVFLIGRDGRSAKSFRCAHTDIRAVAFREDGESLVVAGQGGTVHGHDSDGRVTFSRKLHRGAINEMRFLPATGDVVTIGDDGTLVRYNTIQDEITQRVAIRRGKLFSIAVVSSDSVAVAGSDDDIRIVDMSSGTVTEVLSGHRGSVVALAMSGRHLISAGYDATLRRWNLDDSGEQRVATAEALDR